MKCFAISAFSMEKFIKDELNLLGMQSVRSDRGGVWFEADWDGVFKANMWLRTADRIMIHISEAEIYSFEQLYEHINSIQWEQIIPKDAVFIINGKCLKSRLMSVRDCQRIIKKSIADHLCEYYHYNTCPETGSTYTIHFSIVNDVCSIMLDTSGAALNKRGYRTWNGEAPIRETLAAALLMLSPWYTNMNKMFLYDPCCGTGTFLIEAALMACQIPPGYMRSFAMEDWNVISKRKLQLLREEAISDMLPFESIHIGGSDISPDAIELCRKHLRQAGFTNRIKTEIIPVENCNPLNDRLCFITNPPYGVRLQSRKECELLYKELHKLADRNQTGDISVITPHPAFERVYGRKADRTYRFYNGNLECVDYIYYSGR